MLLNIHIQAEIMDYTSMVLLTNVSKQINIHSMPRRYRHIIISPINGDRHAVYIIFLTCCL